MNPNLHHLFAIAQKPERRIIGLMSGTSLDGLDVALCRFRDSGADTQVQVEQFATVPYTDAVKAEIRRVFAKSEIDFEHLCLLNPWIGLLHADMVLACLREWQISPAAVDCIASHGQTVFHAPQRQHGHPSFPNATLQIGDGDHMAVRSGILTISDFRQKHIAAGGEGAPLAAYGDYLLLSKMGEDRILLNMGGIANFTYLPGSLDATKVFATDVGTGNTLLDAFTRHFFPEKSFDANGDLAAQGHVHGPLLAALLDNLFFTADFPKTTGPELFSMAYVTAAQQRTQANDLSPFDLLATLTQFSAEGIVQAIEQCAPTTSAANLAIYASGGGTYNTVLMNTLRARLPRFAFRTTADLGIHPDAKEAVLFATLANECLVGNPAAQPSQSGRPAVSMGKISFAY